MHLLDQAGASSRSSGTTRDVESSSTWPRSCFATSRRSRRHGPRCRRGLRRADRQRRPVFGICPGHQPVGRGLGRDLQKAPFGRPRRDAYHPSFERATAGASRHEPGHGGTFAEPDSGAASSRSTSTTSLTTRTVRGCGCAAPWACRSTPRRRPGPHDVAGIELELSANSSCASVHDRRAPRVRAVGVFRDAEVREAHRRDRLGADRDRRGLRRSTTPGRRR